MYDNVIGRLEFIRDHWDEIAKMRTHDQLRRLLAETGLWLGADLAVSYLFLGLCDNVFDGCLEDSTKRGLFKTFKEKCPDNASSKKTSRYYPIAPSIEDVSAEEDYSNMINFAHNPNRLALVNFAIQYLKDLNVASTDEVIEE